MLHLDLLGTKLREPIGIRLNSGLTVTARVSAFLIPEVFMTTVTGRVCGFEKHRWMPRQSSRVEHATVDNLHRLAIIPP
jgi:hypothetical protein